MSNYERTIAAALRLPWCIMPEKLAAIQEIIKLRADGDAWSPEEISARLAADNLSANSGDRRESGNGVAVIPIVGTIIPRANMFSEYSGGTSIQGLTKRFRAALADPEVGSIVLDVDSPGGQVGGVPELTSEILSARGTKPIVAVANTLAASAAYWLASAADEIVVSPSAEVGSFGVLAIHEDLSVAYESAGIGVEIISAGKYKAEINPFGPLTDEARAATQARIDDYYNLFLKAVAKGRGVKVSDVRSGFGEGRVVGAKTAVSLGMADRVATLDETIARMLRSRRSDKRAAANMETRRRRMRLASSGVPSDDGAGTGNK